MRTNRKETMFNWRKKEPTALDGEIERLFIELNEWEIDTDEYRLRMEYLERLSALKPEERPKVPSSDAMLQSATTLASVFTIVAYEQKHVLTSKAFGLWNKTK